VGKLLQLAPQTPMPGCSPKTISRDRASPDSPKVNNEVRRQPPSSRSVWDRDQPAIQLFRRRQAATTAVTTPKGNTRGLFFVCSYLIKKSVNRKADPRAAWPVEKPVRYVSGTTAST